MEDDTQMGRASVSSASPTKVLEQVTVHLKAINPCHHRDPAKGVAHKVPHVPVLPLIVVLSGVIPSADTEAITLAIARGLAYPTEKITGMPLNPL